MDLKWLESWLNRLATLFNARRAATPKIVITRRFKWTGYRKPMTSKWTWFTEEEVRGLKEDVVYKLDRARALFGAPIIITSGYRSPEHNDNVGGVKDSSHTKGEAVDIRCHDSELQKKLIFALTAAGFRRMGVYSKHVHVDVSSTLPTPAYWTGESK